MHHLANGILVFHLEALRIYAARLEAHTASNQDSPYLNPPNISYLSTPLCSSPVYSVAHLSSTDTYFAEAFNLDQTTAAGH